MVITHLDSHYLNSCIFIIYFICSKPHKSSPLSCLHHQQVDHLSGDTFPFNILPSGIPQIFAKRDRDLSQWPIMRERRLTIGTLGSPVFHISFRFFRHFILLIWSPQTTDATAATYSLFDIYCVGNDRNCNKWLDDVCKLGLSREVNFAMETLRWLCTKQNFCCAYTDIDCLLNK